MKSDQMGTGHNNPSPRELPLSNQARFNVVAVDINPNAARTAAENAHANGLGGRVMALCSNALSALAPRPIFDVILMAPPIHAGEPLDLADRALQAGPQYRDVALFF